MSTVIKAGRYEIREELGRGAMGVVYRAHDPVIGRDVAVKTMHLSEAGTGMERKELISRFQTEARAAGLLTHPNIVVVYDAGEEEGVFYITMEMVEGRSLQTLIDAHQLFPLPRVMRLMEQACSALDFAHQRNVIHRDIKPANLMLTADDSLKITDFGTAKILQFGTAQTAHVMGTPSYMSPEQVKGKPVDGRSDIFALGVILYELMTGEKPFPGQNITTVIYKIINEDPIPPRALDSSIHQGLSAVITRALAKDPAARFQNCNELLEALKNYRDLVSPNATGGRIRPVKPAVDSDRTQLIVPQRGSSPALKIPAAAEDYPVQEVSRETLEQEAVAQKRGNVLLAVVLLIIIGFMGYRVWPQMLDLWQRLHQPADASEVLPSASSRTPVEPPAASARVETPVPVRAAVLPANPPPAAVAPIPVKVAEKVPAALAVPAVVNSNVALPSPVKTSGIAPAPEAALLKTELLTKLASTPLAYKIKMEVSGSALALSGRLSPREHSALLNLLHDVPASVKVVDNIEYVDELKAAPAVEVGWVWVRSTPPGASILVDGTDTKLESPARVEMSNGEHEVTLMLRGFAMAHRNFQVRSGQSILFNEFLSKQK